MADTPRHHRPTLPGAAHFEAVRDEEDPALRSEAADRAATLLVRGPRDPADPDDVAVAERVVHLAETEGIDEIAALWSGSPADSLAGCLWRLYLLRAWVHSDPVAAAYEFDLGRRHLPVHEVVAGVSEPPGPDDVRRLADDVLRGIRVGEFADTLFRAAAFARVTATGRAHREQEGGSTYRNDLSASRLLVLAEQLETAGRHELAGLLA